MELCLRGGYESQVLEFEVENMQLKVVEVFGNAGRKEVGLWDPSGDA